MVGGLRLNHNSHCKCSCNIYHTLSEFTGEVISLEKNFKDFSHHLAFDFQPSLHPYSGLRSWSAFLLYESFSFLMEI